MRILQPGDAAELPDDGEVEWAPLVPYWEVLWRSGVALARELEGMDIGGRRMVELGCGLGVPSLAAARAGARVLASDMDPDAIELLGRNARDNEVEVETMVASWSNPDALIERGPFDLAVGADVLYERQSVASLLSLLPRLAPEALIVDPGRPASHPFVEQADRRWGVEAERRGVVSLYRMRFGAE
ncbi:MAG TPA: methyltransferase domain-containing protein [Solirubrobacterales bacterium]|nr:methyltransferase domain-containing protein [Solirubrobacterales bacterium]